MRFIKKVISRKELGYSVRLGQKRRKRGFGISIIFFIRKTSILRDDLENKGYSNAFSPDFFSIV